MTQRSFLDHRNEIKVVKSYPKKDNVIIVSADLQHGIKGSDWSDNPEIWPF